MDVIYRNKTEAPTEDGWYYANWIDNDVKNIVPYEVVFETEEGTNLVVLVGDVEFSMAYFEFFGPVPEVREG